MRLILSVLIFLFVGTLHSYAAAPPGTSPTTTPSKTTPPPKKPRKPAPAKIETGPELTVKKSDIPPPPQIGYTLPGIIGKGAAGWIGSDHLLNLTSDINVIVDIVKPENVTLTFTAEQVRKEVLLRFEKHGFDIQFTQQDKGPPLPYFDIQILVQHIEGGYALSIQGQLFEAVTLKRVILPEEVTFQAVTWEKQDLLITPTDQLNQQVYKSVQEITDQFLARFDFFERQKKKLQTEEH